MVCSTMARAALRLRPNVICGVKLRMSMFGYSSIASNESSTRCASACNSGCFATPTQRMQVLRAEAKTPRPAT